MRRSTGQRLHGEGELQTCRPYYVDQHKPKFFFSTAFKTQNSTTAAPALAPTAVTFSLMRRRSRREETVRPHENSKEIRTQS